MGGGDVALTIIFVTVRINGALWFTVIVRAGEASGAVGPGTDTILIGAALGPGIHFITNNIGAVHIAWPVAHWTIRILVTHIKHQGPSPLTLGVTILLMLTVSTLHKTSLSCRTALPESAAV